jgi:hypothetical protein
LHGAPKPGESIRTAPRRTPANKSAAAETPASATSASASASASEAYLPEAAGDTIDGADQPGDPRPDTFAPTAATANGGEDTAPDPTRSAAAPRASASIAPDLSVYGTDAALVASLEGADEPIVPQFDLTIGQVRYAARCEFARTVEDVLARRHRGLLLNARAALAAAPRVALTLATELGHPPVWIEKQLKEFAKIAEPYRVTRREGDPLPPSSVPAQAAPAPSAAAPDLPLQTPPALPAPSAGVELEPTMLRSN